MIYCLVMKKTIKTSKKTVETKLMPKKRVNIVNLHLAALLLVLGLGILAYYRYGIVAMVNGKTVSRLAYIKNMEKQGGKQVLDSMVTETLILAEAQKKGIKIEQSEIDADIQKIEEQIKAQGSTLEEALSTREMTKDELVSQIRLQKMVDKMATPTAEITQAQIDEYLKANKAQLPKTATKEELNKMAKDDLTSQASNEAVGAWLENLKKDAKIIYR